METLWQRRKMEAAAYFENLMSKLKEVELEFLTFNQEERKIYNDLYFDDGLRKIDFIFVFKINEKKKAKTTVNNYIKNLEKEGVHFEAGESDLHPEFLFIKVHVTRATLLMCSVLMNYEPIFMRVPDAPIRETRIINFPFMHTELSRMEPLSEVVQRASQSSLGARPRDFTRSERIMIIGEILKNVRFGDEEHETGLKYLLDHHYLDAAYPLHDSPSMWTPKGILNDRQLLLKYWACISMLFKYQPLDLIYKYHGPEVAFYFAFFGFYNRMLIPVAILGLFAMAYGFMRSDSDTNLYAVHFCGSNEVFCPGCQDSRFCSYRPVAEDCAAARHHFLVDNFFTMSYAIVMCFWATIVSELWKRQENVLKYKWNLLSLEQDPSPRPEYRRQARHKRLSKYTGQYEFYIPQRIRTLKVCCSYICCFFLASIVLFCVVATVIFRLSLTYFMNYNFKLVRENIQIFSNLISTSVLFVFMQIFEYIYKHFSRILTDFETPRTQEQYDRSYVSKLLILSMFNAYAYLYYTAFFKGAFRTYPGDMGQYSSIGIINNDLEGSMGGMPQLGLQLIVIMTAKTIFMMTWEIVLPYALFKYKYYMTVKRLKGKNYTRRSWDREYHRHRNDYYSVTGSEFKTIILQYGYLILFPAAFPLGPLFAFIFNLVEIRIDAYKMTMCKRRHVPLRVPGISAWKTVLSTLSYVGIVTNCFLIAFTTNLYQYIFRDENLSFMNTTYSIFAVKDYPKTSDFANSSVEYCLYKGRRYPPDHPKKYHYNKEYWVALSAQLMIVILLESLVLGFNKLLSFSIPDMSMQIKERIRLRRKRENTAREKRLNEKFQREYHTRHSVAREQLAARLEQMQF